MLYLQIASPKSSVLNFLDSNSFEVIISIFQRTEKVPDMERLRNNNYYYNKDGVPFLSKEQADRCINGKDWKKIVSVSDKVKSDLEKVVKQDFISSNGAYIPEESKRHDVIKQYLNTIPSEQRNSASWTLSRMAGDYASRMETLVKKNNPGWKPGDAFDTSILDQMDDTLGGLDFKV